MEGRIRIRRAALEAILAHARAEAPDECCGLLLGAADLVDEARRARNLRRSPTRYLIDPEDHFQALRAARASAREVVGAYHSHPASPPAPSATDLAEATYPDFVYVIATPGSVSQAADVRAYRLAATGNFERLELVTIP